MQSHVASRARPADGAGFELYSWYFFRVSGLALLFLAIFHVVIMHVIITVDRINYAFIADRWGSPFWRVYDFLLLVLSLLHGLNGARVAIEDYVRRPGWRVAAHTAVWLIGLLFMAIGTLAIVTFNPEASSAAAAAAGR